MTAREPIDLNAAISGLPVALREPVSLWLEHLSERHVDWHDEQLDVATLIRVVASSEWAGRFLLREWAWFKEEVARGTLDRPPDICGVEKAFNSAGSWTDNSDIVKSRLRRARNQQLLHILWRSIVRRGNSDSLNETLQCLSDLADILIRASVSIAEKQLAPRFGVPRTEDELHSQIPLVTLAMGKLGGQELNFSSDVDLIFLYSEEGETDGKRVLSAHEYFVRLSRLVVSFLDEVTEDGFVYRVDTRLRPFGDSGPPVVSFGALEAYLLKHGRGWERYAYLKARVITPVVADPAVEYLTDSVIEPFVYRRYLDYGVFESLRNMKALIAEEVQKRELAGNIKTGPGGIREIEFVVQSLQLVRGGRDEHLRRSQLQKVLPHLGDGNGLQDDAIDSLLTAYNFLRRLENAIQAINDQQTHDVPEDDLDRARLQVAMRSSEWTDLSSALNEYRNNVSDVFAEIAFRSDTDATQSDLAVSLAALWQSKAPSGSWQSVLQESGFAESGLLGDTIAAFAATPLSDKMDVTAERRLAKFIPALFILLQVHERPNTVCQRVLNVISKILRRSAYVALLIENPAALKQLVYLCAESVYIADEIARFPVLLDEMLDPRLYSTRISVSDMRDDLKQRIERAGDIDSEQEIELLAHFQRTTLFRIAVADINGKLPVMKVSDRLTELAELVLQQALRIAWSDLQSRHGRPVYESRNGIVPAGFGVVAYGKLGGMELSYRSDLDLVFIHDGGGAGHSTDGPSPLDNSMFFARLVRRLVHFLTIQTGSGALYEVDTRLRPSGRSGLLVVGVDGFERYQEENAWTWEHQALLRSRPVAGSSKVAREFERIRMETLRNRVRRDQLLDDVIAMRKRMRAQLDKSNEQKFDLKQGKGGIGDIEFLVQYLVLKHAREQAAVVHYPDNIRQLGALGAAGYLSREEVERLQSVYREFRHCLHRLSLNESMPLIPSDEFLDEREFVVSMWAKEMATEE